MEGEGWYLAIIWRCLLLDISIPKRQVGVWEAPMPRLADGKERGRRA